ncbi:MAG: UDP-N-acetylmuramoyl-L-alanyl-D-glutamate--2,6-diaminopimelate ligase [Acidimicrobiia bacterium]|nr:UDP-N-acetylmuramoyl-L-alanyl-D-glutamate--2,6-diaminopimelate ligase [Acidimicrobiia bacterium]NNF11225.1 UDP-N-acetylmuramoyl-L-alanyl-D-glutamate--2,6-diaminopimelate ligase [Acidimicrobiia bacterium]NNL68961.1 UDP-N-acetylmuramoyl-L-alanyl-D-glutamate--2,6-diaminopimelate ligase [Acidimicrobiia bacterium]
MSGEGRQLADLSAVVDGVVQGDGSVRVRDVTHDSRTAGPGDLFVAIRGANADGHAFVAGSAAAAACVESPVEAGLPQLVVGDTRLALPALAAEVHGHPSRELPVLGITGTNGKTTVAHLVAAIVEASGGVPGVIGTVGARIGSQHLPLERTSPEGSDLQRLLRRMVDAGAAVAAVEVSSHALSFGRTAHTEFAVVAFTNLSQDHLDLHGDMESYFQTKARLFMSGDGPAVINVDDEWGRRLAEMSSRQVISVGADGDYRVEMLELELSRSTFRLVTPAGGHTIRLPLGGSFNVENAAIAAAASVALGMDIETVIRGLETVEPIPGRMEPVALGQETAIVVDYAHTPDGIARVLQSVRPLVSGDVIVVVGAGGDRDGDKRPAMGRAAAQADVLYVTSDNPRSEDPAAIIKAVLSGADGPARVTVEPDRRRAIGAAIRSAGPTDAVLILGKGHETGQEVAGRVTPFDDRVVAAEVVAAR